MAEPVAELHLSEYLDIAKRRKLTIISIAVLALTLAVVVSMLQTPRYRAEARVRVAPASSASVTDAGSASSLNTNVRDRNLQNEVEFAGSDRVREAAAVILGDDSSANVSPGLGTDSLVFTGVATSPERAALIANTFSDTYVQERRSAADEQFLGREQLISDRLAEIAEDRRELQTQLANDPGNADIEGLLTALVEEEARRRSQLTEIEIFGQLNQSASVSVLNAAEAPSRAFSPSWIRNLGLALVLGTILGVGSALLIETLDDTIVSKRELERASQGTPVLGVIPPPWRTRRQKKDRRLIAGRTGAFTEAFRSLRSAIELGQATGGELRSILVTSASPAEGKSTVAAHLALAFARSGVNVLVIDADMHNPTQHNLFNVPNDNGLADHLASIGEAEIVVEAASGEGLVSLIPAGTSSSPPAELLSSMLAHEFIQKLSYAYDLVIVDSPPLRPVADTLPLARITDATLLVSMRGQTKEQELEQAMELLARAQTRPLGTVLNGADESDGGYGYGYGYGVRQS